MKKTSLPSTPVCQPITLIVKPSPEPTYQPISVDSMRTSPASGVRRSPTAQSRIGEGCGSGRVIGLICLHEVKYGHREGWSRTSIVGKGVKHA